MGRSGNSINLTGTEKCRDGEGRATRQYKFNVGSNAVTGALTWNPNGTLGQLVITDPLSSANAQTCSYSHDDLVRIASANCTSTPAWSQTFSFDAFGNINKSGNSSFNASYSPSTNRMTMIGSSTPTYDSNGNVMNDFLHTYAWDANGKPVTIDGIGATYDALERMVELNRSGVYGEIVYTPSGGKLALMNGQSLVKAFVPLPGGATAVYSSSGLAYYRHSDWLGSSRLATTPSQTMYGDVAYAPYGETYAQSGTADFSFTGMNEDVEQNANPATLYDFLAREYGIQGRWPSPDPLGVGAVDPTNPQTWNRYAYVYNSPLSFTDPNGECPECLASCSNPFLLPVCIISAIGNIIEFFKTLFDFFSPPPQAAPPPPGGYGTGIDPYGTWNEKLPKGVQVFPRGGFPSINLPSDPGCDWCGNSVIHRYHVRSFTPGHLPYWLTGLFWALRNTNENFHAPDYTAEGQFDPVFDKCLAEELLPINPRNIGKEIGKQGVKVLLKKTAPGLAKGVEEADPIVTAADVAAAMATCTIKLWPKQ